MQQRWAFALAIFLLAAAGLPLRAPLPPPPWRASRTELNPSLSGNGRYLAAELVRRGALTDVWVADLQEGSSWCVTTGADGASHLPQLSLDGRCLVFSSEASNLDPDDDNASSDIFWMDLQQRRLRRLPATGGEPGQSSSFAPALNEDGSVVAACSYGSEPVERDVVIWQLNRAGLALPLERPLGYSVVLGRVALRQGRIAYSVFVQRPGPGSAESRGQVQLWWADLAAPIRRGWATGGRRLLSERGFAPALALSACAFEEEAGIVVFERATNRRERLPSPGTCFEPSISSDGRRVAFTAYARRDRSDVYLYDRQEKRLLCLSRGGDASSYSPCLAADGETLVFATQAGNLPGPLVRWRRFAGRLEKVRMGR